MDPSSPASIVASHISGIGSLIEDAEIKMRNSLQEVYFSSAFAPTASRVVALRRRRSVLICSHPARTTGIPSPRLPFTILLYRSTETKDIVNSLRSSVGYGETSKRNALQGELAGLLLRKGAVVSP